MDPLSAPMAQGHHLADGVETSEVTRKIANLQLKGKGQMEILIISSEAKSSHLGASYGPMHQVRGIILQNTEFYVT